VRGGILRPSCLSRAQVGCACSRGLQASTREGASGLTRAPTRPSPRGQRFEPGGVPGPTSKLSPRALAQMGRRETEREGGSKSEGDGRERWNPAAFVFVPRPGRVRLQ
jgi:hypothetical protein